MREFTIPQDQKLGDLDYPFVNWYSEMVLQAICLNNDQNSHALLELDADVAETVKPGDKVQMLTSNWELAKTAAVETISRLNAAGKFQGRIGAKVWKFYEAMARAEEVKQ